MHDTQWPSYLSKFFTFQGTRCTTLGFFVTKKPFSTRLGDVESWGDASCTPKFEANCKKIVKTRFSSGFRRYGSKPLEFGVVSSFRHHWNVAKSDPKNPTNPLTSQTPQTEVSHLPWIRVLLSNTWWWKTSHQAVAKAVKN